MFTKFVCAQSVLPRIKCYGSGTGEFHKNHQSKFLFSVKEIRDGLFIILKASAFIRVCAQKVLNEPAHRISDAISHCFC